MVVHWSFLVTRPISQSLVCLYHTATCFHQHQHSWFSRGTITLLPPVVRVKTRRHGWPAWHFAAHRVGFNFAKGSYMANFFRTKCPFLEATHVYVRRNFPCENTTTES